MPLKFVSAVVENLSVEDISLLFIKLVNYQIEFPNKKMLYFISHVLNNKMVDKFSFRAVFVFNLLCHGLIDENFGKILSTDSKLLDEVENVIFNFNYSKNKFYNSLIKWMLITFLTKETKEQESVFLRFFVKNSSTLLSYRKKLLEAMLIYLEAKRKVAHAVAIGEKSEEGAKGAIKRVPEKNYLMMTCVAFLRVNMNLWI